MCVHFSRHTIILFTSSSAGQFTKAAAKHRCQPAEFLTIISDLSVCLSFFFYFFFYLPLTLWSSQHKHLEISAPAASNSVSQAALILLQLYLNWLMGQSSPERALQIKIYLRNHVAVQIADCSFAVSCRRDNLALFDDICSAFWKTVTQRLFFFF